MSVCVYTVHAMWCPSLLGYSTVSLSGTNRIMKKHQLLSFCLCCAPARQTRRRQRRRSTRSMPKTMLLFIPLLAFLYSKRSQRAFNCSILSWEHREPFNWAHIENKVIKSGKLRTRNIEMFISFKRVRSFAPRSLFAPCEVPLTSRKNAFYQLFEQFQTVICILNVHCRCHIEQENKWAGERAGLHNSMFLNCWRYLIMHIELHSVPHFQHIECIICAALCAFQQHFFCNLLPKKKERTDRACWLHNRNNIRSISKTINENPFTRLKCRANGYLAIDRSIFSSIRRMMANVLLIISWNRHIQSACHSATSA